MTKLDNRKKTPDQHKSSFLIRFPSEFRERLRALKAKTERPMAVDARRALDRYLTEQGV